MNQAQKHADVVDMNRDPITGSPGSHPVGTGVGSLGGAAIGAMAGIVAGPIGMLVLGTAGALVGGAAGHETAERIDPTGEDDYWRTAHKDRPYVDAKRNYDTDYQPAYAYGVDRRNAAGTRAWDDSLDTELSRDWETRRAKSTLSWDEARPAVRDAWDRADRSYGTHTAADRYYQSRFNDVGYKDPSATFDDYRPAYRYGTQARSTSPTRQWDDSLESDLGRGWDKVKGTSRLTWDKAKDATKDAWNSFERILPGDADNDGR